MSSITLKISKEDKTFVVDNPDAPGSPPIGRGSSIKEAIGDWLINNQMSVGIVFDVKLVQEEVHALITEALSHR